MKCVPVGEERTGFQATLKDFPESVIFTAEGQDVLTVIQHGETTLVVVIGRRRESWRCYVHRTGVKERDYREKWDEFRRVLPEVVQYGGVGTVGYLAIEVEGVGTVGRDVAYVLSRGQALAEAVGWWE